MFDGTLHCTEVRKAAVDVQISPRNSHLLLQCGMTENVLKKKLEKVAIHGAAQWPECLRVGEWIKCGI